MTDAATPETATATETHDLAGAARAIERIIRREAPPAEDAAAPEDEIGIEGGDDADVSAVERDDEEDGEDDESVAGEPRHKVKVDGAETEVALGELIKGYQRGADYTRKTMRLADERRELERAKSELEAERAAAVLERQHYADRLAGRIPALRQQLARFDGIDWNRLAAESPELFAQARPQFESLTRQLQETDAEQLRLRQQERDRQLLAVRAHQDHVAAQKQALIGKQPEMADPVKARQETAALTRYLAEAGYRQDELSRLVDHRDFILARKAMLYDRLIANREQVKETLAALPRVQKPGTARSSRPGTAERRAALMTRLTRSGRVEDAARVIEEML